ncbi:hypothetical protein DL765_004039 [Monosporascus sp. GIB2]|nr:hypothetical protein DL765_004039 [Monosporascus sp. GIB2]
MDQPQKVWAILIGIDKYPPGIKDLEGCVNDINNAESVLRNNIGTPLEVLKITTDNLKESPPTYENILEKFDYVTKGVSKDDFVYFHYSGHGGRQSTSHDTQDQPSTGNPSGFIECLVLHGHRHLEDYELGRRFDKLADAGANLFAVLDCCHSGGGDRTRRQSVRQIDSILPAHPYPGQSEEEVRQVAETHHRAASIRQSYWTRARNYTVLAACQPHHYAYEYGNGSKSRGGALTVTLLTSLETLRQNGQPLTYKTLFYDIRARIGLKAADQHPKLFGIEDREVFSHSSFSSTRQAVINKIGSRRVYIDQGEIHGVKRGEAWDIYPRGVLQLNAPITTITIDRVGAIQSSALLATGVTGVECGCPASIVSVVYGQPLLVLVEDSALRQRLAKEPSIGVEFQEPGHIEAGYEIRATPVGHHKVVDASGTPLPRSPVYIPEQPSVAEMHAFLKTLAHYWRVLNLQNTSSHLHGQFGFAVKDGIATASHGESIVLQLINRRPLDPTLSGWWKAEEITKQSLYFTVLNLRMDGTVTLLVPHVSEGKESLVVAPGQTRDIDLDLEILPTDGDVPEVTDIFKVIVTDQPASFYNLATEHASRDTSEPISVPFEDFNQYFDEVLAGETTTKRAATRDIQVETKWQTAQVSITVRR